MSYKTLNATLLRERECVCGGQYLRSLCEISPEFIPSKDEGVMLVELKNYYLIDLDRLKV